MCGLIQDVNVTIYNEIKYAKIFVVHVQMAYVINALLLTMEILHIVIVNNLYKLGCYYGCTSCTSY